MSPFLCFREASERRLSRMDCLNGDKFERFQEFKKKMACVSVTNFFRRGSRKCLLSINRENNFLGFIFVTKILK